ncbi:MAG: DMT family transporter [Firmicutes bacterium]|nr:DMT family transporter [Candidatus Fermentithermobacillaceae bacterium]
MQDLEPTRFRVRSSLRELQADLLLLAVTLIWGSTFVIVKGAIAETPPFTFLFLRFFIASAFLFTWVVVSRRSRLRRVVRSSLIRDEEAIRQARTTARALVTGLVLFFAYATQTIGLLTVDAAKAAFITGFSVVLVPLFTPLVFGTRQDVWVWLGVLLATVGLFFMSFRLPFAVEWGDLWVMACALGYAAHILLVAVFSPSVEPLEFTAIQLAVVSAGSLAGAVVLERPLRVHLRTVPAIVFTGIFATSVAFLVQAWAQRYTSPTHTAVIFAAEPVFGAMFAWLLAGETLTLRETIGAACILGGILMTEVLPVFELSRVRSAGALERQEEESGSNGDA